MAKEVRSHNRGGTLEQEEELGGKALVLAQTGW